MVKKNLFGLIAFLVGVVLVFALVGCKGDADNSSSSLASDISGDGGSTPGSGLPGPAEQTGQGSGWPSAKLSAYSHGGWNQSAGLSGISWVERHVSGRDIYFLDITFTSATENTKDSINDYLESWVSVTPNWIQNEQNIFEVTYRYKFVDSFQYSVFVAYNTSLGNFIQLTRVSEVSELQ